MTLTSEQCDALEAKARNCRDNANAEMIVSEIYREEYMRGISGHTDASAATNARSMELYDFVIGGQNRAKNFVRDAELFEAAAAVGRLVLSSQMRATQGE
ncbi:hypothetical protein ACVIYH_009063 [Bradyrhizobium diazoefficiens]